jgi:hypothetical protein
VLAGSIGVRGSEDLEARRLGTRAFSARFPHATTELIRRLTNMGRGLVLWLVGIPLPVILILYFLGYLH